MLKTQYFEFNRFGQLTIFAERMSYGNLIKIVRMCVAHARRKKTKKPIEFRFIPVLTDVVA